MFKQKADDLPKRITQSDLERLMILEDASHPWRSKIIRAVQNGAEIEPGPLTIHTPVFDDGPLVTLRTARDPLALTRRILESHAALVRAIERGQYLQDVSPEVRARLRLNALSEFEIASNRLKANAWELWRQEYDRARMQRNWAKFPDLLHEWARIKEMAWFLSAGGCALRFGFETIARKSARAALANTSFLIRATAAAPSR